MDGKEFARMVEGELARRGISKSEFYEAVGVSPTALYGWKRGAEPKRDTVETIEKFLQMSLSERGRKEQEDIRESLREDLRILLRSASDLPPSSVYQLIAQIEKEKENAT